MDVDLHMVETAIEKLFDPLAGQAASQEANRFLCELQECPQAWTLSWQLLALNKDLKCQMVGAAMVTSQICKGLRQLQPIQLSALREQLVGTIVAHASGPLPSNQQVAVRLTLALAAMAARTLLFFWQSAVTDMIENFRDSQPILLFEFLARLPEEAAQLEKPDNHANTLRVSATSVLSLCQSALASPIANLRITAMRTVTQWVPLAPAEELPANLCITLLDHLTDDHEHACDAILSFLQHPDGPHYPKLMGDLLEQVAVKCGPIVETKRACGDQDALFSIYSLLTGMGEMHTNLILASLLPDSSNRPGTEMLLKMLLDCVGTPGQYPSEEIISRIPITFWHILLDELARVEPSTQMAKLTLQLQPVYEQLVKLMLRKSQLPDPGTMDLDEKEDLRCYRQDIADCYMYIATMLPAPVFYFFISALDTAVAEYSETKNAKVIEACLFALNAIGDMADSEDDSPVVGAVLALLPRIPPAGDEVLSQVMTAVGIFAEKTSGENIGPLVHLLLRGLQQAGTSASASMALKDLARTHGDRLAPAANDILQAIAVVLHPQSPLPLKHRDRVRLVAIVGHVVSALSSTEQALTSLSALMAPFVQQLNEITNFPGVTATFREATKENLDLLQSMFASLTFCQEGDAAQQSSRPGQVLVEQLMPLFKLIAAKYSCDAEVVSNLAECIRKAVPVLELEPHCVVLSELLSMCGALLMHHPNASVLGAATSVLAHTKANQTSPMCAQFKSICDICFAYFSQDLHGCTDAVESFYKLHAVLFKKRLRYYDQNVFSLDDLIQLCKYATLATTLPEQFTYRAAISFLTQFVNASERSPFVKEALELCSENIIAQLVQNIRGGVSRNFIEAEADVFLALNKTALPLLTAALQRFVSAPIDEPSPESRQNFARQILRERSNKRMLCKVIIDFTLEWRNLSGEYGRATTNLHL
ncbi:importin-13-like [Varroa jacobsoni]|uniref:Exportin-1/Importin-beta-like domain-containing protein n=1 Tax=Varroa destructor TaxID=109461 RepID=A0A7M7JJE5_VARDE|nr:importin-13-like [Varroa destructor]XP_022687710.1 importin-13-like [Varroa jacobsoni]